MKWSLEFFLITRDLKDSAFYHFLEKVYAQEPKFLKTHSYRYRVLPVAQFVKHTWFVKSTLLKSFFVGRRVTFIFLIMFLV
jgi:hypothetical protein